MAVRRSTRMAVRVSLALAMLACLAIGARPAWASAGGSPTTRGVHPVVASSGGPDAAAECAVLSGRSDLTALRLPGQDDGFPPAGPVGDGAQSVTITGWDATARSFDWSATIPVLGVWVDGAGSQGEWYDYASFSDRGPGTGADHDGALHAETVAGAPGPLSHVTFCYAPSAPGLGVTGDSDAPTPLERGDTFTYTIVVTDPGTQPLRRLHLHDRVPAGLRVIHLLPTFEGGICTAASSIDSHGWRRDTVDCTRQALAPGASAEASIEVEVTDATPCGPLTNVVTVEAANAPGGRAARVTLSDRLACTSSIALVERAPAFARHGDIATLAFRVRNDGDAPLHGISLRASACDRPPHRVSSGNGDGSLSPGETWGFTCRGGVHAARGVVHPSAVVRAVGPRGVVVSATDRTLVRIVRPAIGLRVVSPSPATPGTHVTFRYVVTNPGDTPLRHVRVVDPSGVVGSVARLAPGASRVYVRTVVLPSSGAALRSSARATASDVTGHRVADDAETYVRIVATSGPGGTAFTGPEIGPPLASALTLALVGLAALALARPRRRA